MTTPNLDLFFQHYPYMRPFVGTNYTSSKHRKLLLVGESFYMPVNSTVHHNVVDWYNGKIVLTPDEQNHCNTKGTREGGTAPFIQKIEKQLQLVSRVSKNGWQEVSFINYFLRPSDHGISIKNVLENTAESEIEFDRTYALYNLLHTMDILKPDVVVILSDYVCEKFAEKDYPRYFPNEELWDWTGNHNIEYAYVNHPSRQCWYRPMNKYWKFNKFKDNLDESKKANYRACDFFHDFLVQNW